MPAGCKCSTLANLFANICSVSAPRILYSVPRFGSKRGPLSFTVSARVGSHFSSDGYNHPAMFTRDPGHLDHLDALRGIAVLGVVLVHSFVWFGHPLVLPGSVASVAFSGQRGVQLFFIISAFTLFLSHDQRKGESAPLRNFFIRRICRIAPMFWLAALLSYLWLRPWFGTPAQFLPSLFLVQGFLPYSIGYGPAGGWSVGTEVCFYLSLPLLQHWIRRPRDTVIALTISLPAMYLLGRGLAHFDHANVGYYTFNGYLVNLPVFLMGVAAYFLYKRGARGERFISALLITLACTLYFALLPFSLFDTVCRICSGCFASNRINALSVGDARQPPHMLSGQDFLQYLSLAFLHHPRGSGITGSASQRRSVLWNNPLGCVLPSHAAFHRSARLRNMAVGGRTGHPRW